MTPFLDQVAKRDPVSAVALGDRNDEAQIRVDHPLLCLRVSALDPLGEGDLLGRRQKLMLAELVHEERHRISDPAEVGFET